MLRQSLPQLSLLVGMLSGAAACGESDGCAGCAKDGNGNDVQGANDCVFNGGECFRTDGATHCEPNGDNQGGDNQGGDNQGSGACSADTLCPIGDFCNYDRGNSGVCEPCNDCGGPDPDQCNSCGLPSAGVNDCINACASDGPPSAEHVQATCPEEYAACAGACATQLESLLSGSMNPSSVVPGSPLGDVLDCVNAVDDGESGSDGEEDFEASAEHIQAACPDEYAA